MASPRWRGRVRVRLAAAFVAVAVLAVALVAGLTTAFARSDVARLVNDQRSELTEAVAVAAAASWDRSDSWRVADVLPVLDLAVRDGADVRVVDAAGRTVAVTPGFQTRRHAASLVAPVRAGGMRVGQVTLRFTGSGVGRAGQSLLSALLRAIAVACALSVALALVVGILAASRITRPLERLIQTARAMTRGDRTARVGALRAADELRELGASLDAMADTVIREDELRRNLVADVAHELRTPIAILQAGHEALLDGVVPLTDEQLASLRDEVLRLARMVDDLQTLASAEAAALQLARRPADLAQAAAVAADSMQPRFEAARVTLIRELAPAAASLDERWTHQLITNLLGNAAKFTPAGGQVILSVRASEDGAELRVSDTGPGVAREDIGLVTQRFWRGAATAETPGSGVGMAVVAELARAHQAELIIDSDLGRGVTVTLRFPEVRNPEIAPDLHAVSTRSAPRSV